MRVSESRTLYCCPPSSTIEDIITYYRKEVVTLNSSLLLLEKQADGTPEILSHNNTAMANLNKSEETLKKFTLEKNQQNKVANNNERKDLNLIESRLQCLKIKFGLLAIKHGYDSWESYFLSNEVYHNNEQFIASSNCSLSIQTMIDFNITKTQRDYYFQCCQYNFSHALIFNDIPRPADQGNELFYNMAIPLLSEMTPSIVIAITNAKNAMLLCKESFGDNPLSGDALFIAITELNDFYKEVLANILSNDFSGDLPSNLVNDYYKLLEYNVFIPTDILKYIKKPESN
ncbi:hypothetical protein [Plesiomonas sp.]|uniref:hypothetical protein n=1 Tax=Plesiomonas sp. TaxID=2486279 RepID=UPI003F3EC467